MIDIDHFKAYNDHYGHQAGDRCLQQVAAALAAEIRRGSDCVARYGGEEFAIILPETPPDSALEVAERIRRNVKNHPFWGRNDTPVTVTVSVGLACDPSSVMEPRALIDVADSGLYRCKHEGRDRVSRTICRADAPPEIQSSRQESAPEPTLRRRKRATQTLSADEWDRYLTGHFAAAINDWLLAAQVAPWVPQAQDVLRELATRSLDALRQRLTTLAGGVPNETQDLGTLAHPTLDHAVFDRFSACGINQVQLEWILITLQHRIHNLIQGAPFSLEERVAISQNQDYLAQALLLGRAEYWQARIVNQAHTEAPQS
jgi:diguanylate cyclase (GGDEF)-like protein